MSVYLKEDDMTDITRIDEYNDEYKAMYPDFVPFVTKENFDEFLKKVEEAKNGINNNGICEIYYWAIENNKIIGHASIRINPEVDDAIEQYSGHIMYGIVPSKRKQGYGTIVCHLLIKKAQELGFENVIVTCNEKNEGSTKIIEKNSGVLLDIIHNKDDNGKTKRYVINVENSLKNFEKIIIKPCDDISHKEK